MALDDAIGDLRCSQCARGLTREERVLRCASGHAFDVARQGYVTLAGGRGLPPADSATMVAARVAFLAAGHLVPLTAAVVDEVAAAGAPGCVVDVGAGPGHHLAAVLAATSRTGIGLDASAAACRRAASAHPRLAAVRCDAWGPLPLRDGCAAVVLDVFAPRNPAEFARVLAPGGVLLVAAPAPAHLRELRGPLGLLAVPEDKDERIGARLAPHFTQAGRRELRWTMALSREHALAAAAMGPGAHHVDAEELAARAARLAPSTRVTAAVTVARWTPTLAPRGLSPERHPLS